MKWLELVGFFVFLFVGCFAAAAVPQVLATWKHEREIQRQRLTATQVKKAFTKAVKNPATDQPWSRDDALAELLSRGWSSQDANTFLDE